MIKKSEGLEFLGYSHFQIIYSLWALECIVILYELF